MKIKALLRVLCLCIGWLPSVQAQNDAKCYQYACMIERAKQYAKDKQFEAAINSVLAAKNYSDAKVAEADLVIKDIFIQIEQLRQNEARAKKAAEEAANVAQNATKIARIAEWKANAERDSAFKARQEAVEARLKVDTLVKKGKRLESTFSESGTYTYLYQTGLRHFTWDKIAQSRDYLNALTYFALARFLVPSDSLDRLVFAAKTGISAESDFLHGLLDSAQVKYARIQTRLDSTTHRADFEIWRMEQIGQVKDLFADFQHTHDPQKTTKAVLKGNWWTIPAAFTQYQQITSLHLQQVPITLRRAPTVLATLPHLYALTLDYCPNIRQLHDWGTLRHLTALTLRNNANLYNLDSLERVEGLASLVVNNCPALTHIHGCAKLESFTAQKSPQVRIAPLLRQNPTLKRLELADFPNGDSLPLGQLTQLQQLTLATMEIRCLEGLDQNSQLRNLRLEKINQLKTFKQPTQLTQAYISGCDSLRTLENWPLSEQMQALVLYENDNLKHLPHWDALPNLKRVLIQQNDSITNLKGIGKIRTAERLIMVNNDNLMTNSLHIGIGADWSLRPTSAKVEFEHRQRVEKPFANQNIGFKATFAYVQRTFQDNDLYIPRQTKGYMGGAVATYYSPYIFYIGLGVGLIHTRNTLLDQPTTSSTQFVWINNLGFLYTPWFMKKDKLGVGVDIYNVFEKKDYYILPSFGLTYYYTLGFNRKTRLIRRSDYTQPFRRKKHRNWLDQLPASFEPTD